MYLNTMEEIAYPCVFFTNGNMEVLQSIVDVVICRKCRACNECGRKWFIGVVARNMQEFAKTGNARIHVFGNRQLSHSTSLSKTNPSVVFGIYFTPVHC